MTHLAVLVAWHDSGWNGRVCRNPKENKFCEVPIWIKRGKYGFYTVIENNVTKFKRIPSSDCNSNRNKPYNIAIGNKWYVCPFEMRMFDGEHNLLIYALVGKRIRSMDKNKIVDFVESLEYFYNNSKSLCFTYCNESPLENKIVCACIKPREKLIKFRTDESNKNGVKSIEKSVNFKDIIEKAEKGEKLVLEERDDRTKVMKKRSYFTIELMYEPKDVVFIIPYQELAEYYGGYDKIPEEFVLKVPQEVSKSFYNNFLSNELAISILEQALKIIEKINEKLKDDPKLLDYLKMFREKFINISEFPDRIKECIKQLKNYPGFKYPGLPSVLRYLGSDRAISIYIDAVKNEKEKEMYNSIKESLKRGEICPEYGIVGRVLNEFNRRAKYIREFLMDYLPFYDLTRTQIEEIIKQHNKFIDIEKFLENPYLLYEDLKPKEDVIELSFWEIDGWEFNRLRDNFNLIDKHRIRAMLIAILRRALNDGHTVLPQPLRDLPSVKIDLKHYFDLISDLLPEDRRVDFERFLELIEENKEFISEKVWIGETEFKDELNRGHEIKLLALREIREKEESIENFINQMIEKEYDINIIDDNIEKLLASREPEGISKEEYKKAVNDQIKAVKVLLSNGCSILTGSAGSGKTYTIKALLELVCKHEKPRNITILAPTGKASVRIREVIKDVLERYNRIINEPMTIHRFITKHSDFDRDYYIFKPEVKEPIDILIIDEASMVGTELLYDLLQCVDETNLKRIIFIGDNNQLPPIEAGKPFFDLYNYLQTLERERGRKYIAKLEICLRSESRKIVELSKLYKYSTDKSEKERIMDELISNMEMISDNLIKYSLKDNGIERVVIVVWRGDDERFYEALEYAIDKLIEENGGNPNDYRDFFNHFVFNDEIQILTPTKMRGKFGSFRVNYWIRDDSKYTEKVRDRLIQYDFACSENFADKVIQTVNNWNLDVWNYKIRQEIKKHGVFNGMMGYVAYTRDRKRIIRFYFPTIQIFINKIKDQLEYAYAITTHKSQGSEFYNIIFILPPNLGRFVSKELMYTALTRSIKKLCIIVKDNINELFELGKFSEVNSRYSILLNAQIDPRAHPESLRIITLRGDIVRSWQECLIANMLCYENVDYVYEPKFEMSHMNLIPDFELNSKYEKIIFWEHFGMTDNEDYRRYANKKLRLYEKGGFGIIELRSLDERKIKDIFNNYNKILIVSYTEDVRNSHDLYKKIKILKKLLHIKSL